MKRIFFDFLIAWLASERRKPLIVRGARQVGKTSTINSEVGVRPQSGVG